MARRKRQFMDDGSDSGDSSNADDGDDFDPNDPDIAAERELFSNPYARGKKRGRQQQKEEATYGVWAEEDDDSKGSGKGKSRGSKRVDYMAGQAFVSAGASSSAAPQVLDNLSTVFSIDGAEAEQKQDSQVDEDGDAMELDSDVDSDDSEPEDDGEGMSADEDEEELAAVPGLEPPAAAELETEETVPEAALSFAPRGIGSKGKGGIGAGRAGIGGGIGSRAGIGGGGGGIGSRGGIGSSSTASSSSAAPTFASATSASAMPLGGIGMKQAGHESPMAGAATPKMGIGARTGLGGAGTGSKPSQSLVDSLRAQLADQAATTSPSASTSAAPPEPRERRSFLPTASPSLAANKPPPKISKKEQAHFAQLASTGSVGLKMLEKMGWKSGTGLGANEQGIVTPIGEGQKLRKKGAGIASGERSAGAIAEAARMRGEDPDEVERMEKEGRKAAKVKPPKVTKDAWQQPKRKEPKIKTEYKTYEQIVAESGAEPEGVGMLVDLSGNALPSQSLSSLTAFGAGSADPTRLPELRHNLSLLTSTVSASLAALAREGKGVEERRKYINHEEERMRKLVESEELAMTRLKGVMASVAKIKEIEKETMGLLMAGGADELGPQVLLDPFKDEFDELLGNFPNEYDEMRLDEVVVGAIAPVCRRLFQDWDPLSAPELAVPQLKRWRNHFQIDKDVVQVDGMEIDVFGAANFSNAGSSKNGSDRVMTAFETLMWSIWLPRVRSAINNAWSPSDPAPAVALYTAWTPLLPLFLRDNILDQLILPKVSKAIMDWSPSSMRRGGASLHTIVFPWLEHAGQRMDQILDEAKRKIRAWLKSWKVSDGVPKGLDSWRDAFSKSDWDSLIIKHVLPQLGTTLRETFTINPRQQDLKPLEDVLAWSSLLRSSMMTQLLESGFFPKWLDALYIWLTSEPNLEQVAQWYSYWKSYFPDEIVALSGVSRGFKKGLDLMNQAMALGDDAKYRLKRPDTSISTSSSHTPSSTHHKSSKHRKPQPVTEVSFRSIVEEFAAEANLVFLPTGKSDEKGHPLFRVSKNVDGKGGVTIYLDEDVVWLQEGSSWNPVGIEAMVQRASK